jgi:hypothetical protein
VTSSSPGVSFDTVCTLATALPGVEEGMSWGTPGLKLNGRFLARLKEDGESLVLRIGFQRRDELLNGSPEVFYITDHYRGYPAVVVRLPVVRKTVLRKLLKEAWGEVAAESVLAENRSRRGRAGKKTIKRRA